MKRIRRSITDHPVRKFRTFSKNSGVEEYDSLNRKDRRAVAKKYRTNSRRTRNN